MFLFICLWFVGYFKIWDVMIFLWDSIVVLVFLIKLLVCCMWLWNFFVDWLNFVIELICLGLLYIGWWLCWRCIVCWGVVRMVIGGLVWLLLNLWFMLMIYCWWCVWWYCFSCVMLLVKVCRYIVVRECCGFVWLYWN